MRASVEEARRHLDRLRISLAAPSPRVIEEILPELENAVESMREIERKMQRGERMPFNMELDLMALSREIGIVRRLADRGLELCNGWAVLLATTAGGSVSSGKPAPLHPGPTLRIEG